MQYFVGKVCTIFLSPINRKFDEETSSKHFVVLVRDIDVDGVWGNNLINDLVSWFSFEKIQSIQEELEIDPDNPDHMKLLEKLQEPAKPADCEGCHAPPPAVPQDAEGDATFVDIESLAKLAAQTKKSYESMED